MTNEELYDEAVKAATALFGDSSVSQSETRSQLEALKNEIDAMLDTLEE